MYLRAVESLIFNGAHNFLIVDLEYRSPFSSCRTSDASVVVNCSYFKRINGIIVIHTIAASVSYLYGCELCAINDDLCAK